MVNFNIWDRIWGSKKKRINFIKDAKKQIKKNTLYYLQDYGRRNWVTTDEIFLKTLLNTDLFNEDDGRKWFLSMGVKGQIHNATHDLRLDGYPIISGKGKKGYRYADEQADDFIERWDELKSAWEERKTNLNNEADNYEKLIEKIIERLKEKRRLEEAKKMEEIKVYFQRRKNQDEN